MTLLDIRHAAARPGWFADVAARWTAARSRRALYRQTVSELDALTDRELADIGIHRSQIATIAAEAAL